jgi:hypothetical protein
MKLLGTNFTAPELMARIEGRLRARGLWSPPKSPPPSQGIEPPVDPLSFNLQALEEHADPTRPLPLSTHRAGLGRLVLLAKWTFRKTCQVLINEALARQKVFNGHVRDSYAQLSADVLRLQQDVQKLRPRRPSRHRSAAKS